ncbi:MAG TPA: ATP-binding protein [Mucilaginibacter sp.]|nr:ATP-binding protein [Mucilaginibacter sp.]
MSDKLQFKISSALKDIIGKDLITDDFIAVFELVKNSYDAYAKKVKITFENINTPKASITIEDDGKGMSLDDIKQKWLFVAYSAKKEGTEDRSFDYRQNISSNRSFAGAKGIGRFSCDRLGKWLYLESTKQSNNPTTEIIITDWEQFEEDIQREFVDVEVVHETKSKSDYGLEHGTVLVITELRSYWDREKLLKLKASLAKLINPSKNKSDDFSIFINAPELQQIDDSEDEYYRKVNGEVRNFIFDTLGLKTTSIHTRIDEDGKTISTELYDGGTLVYRIKEINKYSFLYGISYTIYYLNRSAKATFTRRMGVQSVNFGHIFLYKNGFRIYPYGEPGEDPLKLDARKAQGARRYLGTRELIGQIEIFNDSDQLKETSSRGDGLIKTPTYEQLETCFREVLRRLERYVVDVQQWGLSIEDNQDIDMRSRITNLIARLSGGEDILEFEYNENFLEALQETQSESVERIVRNLNRIALASGDETLINEAKKAAKSLEAIKQAKEEAESNEIEALKQKQEIETELKLTIAQNLILKEAANEDTVEILSIEHHVNQATHRVDKLLQKLINGLQEGATIENLINLANGISLENRKIASLVNFVRKANFDTMSSKYTGDIIAYITQYVENIYKEDKARIINNTIIDVSTNFNRDEHVVGEFIPLEVNIILDNLLDNSFKAHATYAELFITKIAEKTINVMYQDNGLGVNPNISDKIFEFGFTTTQGSGIGLFHIKKLLEDNYNGYIWLDTDVRQGAKFDIQLTVK